MAATALETTEFRYAGFWIRLVAYIIDAILFGIIAAILGVIFGLRGSTADAGTSAASAAGPILFVLEWLYFAGLESSSWQATLGKKICGLRVADLEGNRISFGRATGRYFAKIISAIILFIGFLMAGWTHRKQGLHDKIAGTIVLRRMTVFQPAVREVGHIGGLRVTTQIGGIDRDR